MMALYGVGRSRNVLSQADSRDQCMDTVTSIGGMRNPPRLLRIALSNNRETRRAVRSRSSKYHKNGLEKKFDESSFSIEKLKAILGRR